jgi:hypothetical protein
MVTAAGVKIKVKAKTKREPNAKLGALGEPIWDADRAICFEDAEYDHYLRKSLNYYNYNFTQKDLKKYVAVWMHENAKWGKEELAAYADTEPTKTSMTLCGVVKAAGMGMPIREKDKKYLISEMNAVIAPVLAEHKAAAEAAKLIAKVKGQTVYAAPTIQDRLAEKTAEVIGEIEGQVDNIFANKPMDFKIYDFLTTKGVAQSQIGKIRAVFQRQIEEITAYVGGKDAQLKEAYAHLKKADLKRIGDFYVKLMADLDSYTQVKKAVKKARVKKAVPAVKLVNKVKYMKEDKALKIVSINPAHIVGAKELWCFDTKTRKLIHYVADQYALELSVKGTTIQGFDTTKSIAKTLRKPEVSLHEFMKTSKIQRRTYMQQIKAVEVRATGRLNENQLLIRVD